MAKAPTANDAEAPPVDYKAENEPLLQNMKRELFINRVTDLPNVLKQRFVKQAYGVVLLSLLVAFLISIPFMENPEGAIDFLSIHYGIMVIAVLILVLQLLFYVSVLGALRIWGEKMILDSYVNLLRKPPACLAYSLVFSLCTGLVVAAVLACFHWADVCIWYVYTGVNVLGLYFFMFAFQRKADFQTMYGYQVPVVGAVLCGLFTCIKSYVNGGAFFNLTLTQLIALAMSVGFGWILVFDTQIIFGARNEKGRKFPYISEQWCFAGYEMYFDLYHFYFQSLKLIPGAAKYHDPSL